MILAEPGEDLANRRSSHAVLAGTAAGGAVILAAVVPHLDEIEFNTLKMSQEDEIKKAEKKLASLQDEQSKLQKKLADINKEIDKNAKDQNSANLELEEKKADLAKFLEKREGGKKKN
jgi:peptidoglycan hydrolase CwlO-like protein